MDNQDAYGYFAALLSWQYPQSQGNSTSMMDLANTNAATKALESRLARARRIAAEVCARRDEMKVGRIK